MTWTFCAQNFTIMFNHEGTKTQSNANLKLCAFVPLWFNIRIVED